MAVGKKITSAFSGPADVSSFDMINHVPSSHTIKQKKSSKREELENLYLNIRKLREGKTAEITLKEAFGAVTASHENDWLLSVEITELAKKENHSDLIEKVLNHLEKVKTKRPEIAHLIDGGLALIFEKQTT
jgi:phenylalanine-4-hydroxylase